MIAEISKEELREGLIKRMGVVVKELDKLWWEKEELVKKIRVLDVDIFVSKEGPLIDEIKKYASRLAELDDSIIHVFLIGSLVNGEFNLKSDIDIVLDFNPEPDDREGYNKIYALQEKIEGGISGYPVDLGFRTGSDVFLGGGLISTYMGNYMLLWEREGYEF